MKMKMSLSQYKKAKVKMLTRDFLIKLTSEQIEHINSLASEIEVDRYARTILDNAWE